MLLKVLSITSIALGLMGLYSSDSSYSDDDEYEGFTKGQFLLSKEGDKVYAGLPVGSLLAVTADWCGYCVELKKNVKAAGLKMAYYIDATNPDADVKQQMDVLGVKSFPSVFIVGMGGLLAKYTGGRDPESLSANFSK